MTNDIHKFIRHLIIFALLTALMDILLCPLFSYLQHHATGENGRITFIHDSLKSEALILGSSRALHHYDPNIIGTEINMDCYNAGEDRMGIVMNLARLKMVSSRQMPKLIIYDVEPDYDLLEDNNTTYLAILRPYYHRPGVDSIFWMVDKQERIKMLFHPYIYNSRINGLLRDNLNPPMSYNKGYVPYIGQGKFIQEKSPQDKYDRLKSLLIDKLIADYKGKTAIVFVASPQLSYRSDSVFTRFQLMCSDKNIPFLNHFCDTEFTSHHELFHNCNHLNKDGARLFSQRIAKEIDSCLQTRNTRHGNITMSSTTSVYSRQ